MAIKKSELYSSLWKSCDELRGGMDASQYKDYVLVLLFMKYVSDRYEGKEDALIEIPKGGSFRDMIALKGTKDIGEGINTIIANLAEANELKGVIDVADFDDDDKLGKGKDKQDRLSNLISIFEHPSLNGCANCHDLIRVDSLVWLFTKKLLHLMLYPRHSRHPTHENDFVNRAPIQAGIAQCLLHRRPQAIDEAFNERFQLGPGQFNVHVLGA